MLRRGRGGWRWAAVTVLLAALVLGFAFVLRAVGLSAAANVAQLVSLAPLTVGLFGWAQRQRDASGTSGDGSAPADATGAATTPGAGAPGAGQAPPTAPPSGPRLDLVLPPRVLRLIVATVSALILGFSGYLGYLIGDTGRPVIVPGPETRNSTGSSAASSPASAGARSHPATATAGSEGLGGYTLKYSDTQFTLPGGGCQSGDIVMPAWVTFTGFGPDVTTFTGSIQVPGGGNGDLELDCELGNGNASPGIDFSGSQAVAEVTGTPGPSACELAITRNPLVGGIEFATLSKGMQFCVDAASGLLARITLVSADNTTYNLTWAVTTWSPPS